jgi:hypothetical protein
VNKEQVENGLGVIACDRCPGRFCVDAKLGKNIAIYVFENEHLKKILTGEKTKDCIIYERTNGSGGV